MRTPTSTLIPMVAPRLGPMTTFPWHTEAANGRLIRALRAGSTGDLNIIVRCVARALERAGAIARPRLELAPTLPSIAADPGALAFALAGLVRLMAQPEESGRPGRVTLRTIRRGRHTRLIVAAADLPALAVIRGLLPKACARGHRLARSCARIIRDAHGALDLIEGKGGVALAVELPAALDEDRATQPHPAWISQFSAADLRGRLDVFSPIAA